MADGLSGLPPLSTAPRSPPSRHLPSRPCRKGNLALLCQEGGLTPDRGWGCGSTAELGARAAVVYVPVARSWERPGLQLDCSLLVVTGQRGGRFWNRHTRAHTRARIHSHTHVHLHTRSPRHTYPALHPLHPQDGVTETRLHAHTCVCTHVVTDAFTHEPRALLGPSLLSLSLKLSPRPVSAWEPAGQCCRQGAA